MQCYLHSNLCYTIVYIAFLLFLIRKKVELKILVISYYSLILQKLILIYLFIFTFEGLENVWVKF